MNFVQKIVQGTCFAAAALFVALDNLPVFFFATFLFPCIPSFAPTDEKCLQRADPQAAQARAELSDI